MLIKETLPKLGSDVVMVSIDGDPNENAPQLKRYADELGLGWRFAIAPRELMASLASTFGNDVLYPPSDPMFAVSASGTAHKLSSGPKDEEVLRQAIERYRDQ